MKTLKTILILVTFAIIAFAWYVTNEPQPDTWISDHSEISEYEVYGERMMEQTIERSKQVTDITHDTWYEYDDIGIDSAIVTINGVVVYKGKKYSEVKAFINHKYLQPYPVSDEYGCFACEIGGDDLKPKNHFGKIVDSLKRIK